MAAPRTHTSLAALHALLTLPADLREAVGESMRRDAKDQSLSAREAPADLSRISMTAHLREVLVERSLMDVWRRHFQDCRFAVRTRAESERESVFLPALELASVSA